MTLAQSPNAPSGFRLPRTLSLPETWGYGLVAGPAGWLGLIAAIHLALGDRAIWVWIPSTIVGIIINCQVKQIAQQSFDVAGGTPNYIARLFRNYPLIARYGAIGYLLNWLAAYALCASQLGDILYNNLPFLQDNIPLWLNKAFFMILPLAVGFNGTRALSILILLIATIALGLYLAFTLQGFGWLLTAPASPGLWGSTIPGPIGFVDWAKWFFFISYATYSGETTATFLADTRRPQAALRILDATSSLMVVVFLGASWIVSRIAPTDLKEDIFAVLSAAATPFWGEHTQLLVTTLIATSAMLVQATGLALSSRVIYQLAQDQFLAPVFQAISHRGVAGPALALTFATACLYYYWGQWNLTQLLVAGNASWFVAFTLFHGGLWQRWRHHKNAWYYVALIVFLLETIVIWVGGHQWGFQSWLIGLACPFSIMALDRAITKIHLPIFQLQWWQNHYQRPPQIRFKDPLTQQVLVISALTLTALFIGWAARELSFAALGTHAESRNVLVMISLAVLLMAIAIACWTTLPTIMTLAETKQAAEHLLDNAQDGILVVNQQGQIQRANPIVLKLFGQSEQQLIGQHLSQWIPQLRHTTPTWPHQLETEITPNPIAPALIFQISISTPTEASFGEAVVILHDISDRYRVEAILRESAAKLRSEAQQLANQLLQSEKMSSLGQMVAGLAHEINNPISFIHGNLKHTQAHAQTLLAAIQHYQQAYPNPSPELHQALEELDLDFVQTDLPKALSSMQVGSSRIRDLILSLRNFSRLDESEFKTVNLHDGLESTILLLSHRLRGGSDRPDITITKQYGDFPPVGCCAGQLNQVFMNLLNNAIDAIEAAYQTNSALLPEITIHTSIQDHQWILIAITDNGIGIPAAMRSRIFDPFFTTKPVGQGTGLGLSLSYQIITKLHQGELTCNSEPGQGSTFTIAFPNQV